ncbi:CatB-related O-acetyltransferase [Aeromonas sp. QDB12]|uniref:CatB-related O-acetyltransferase n=1 Tax=Aeromonas sp. QDB12 TaxID=2990483 RepID=UPI0022E16330|nr:CatB-related O-acetyltransferase [Aeromonas sp. QDB12]
MHRFIINMIKLYILRRRWRKCNQHNKTDLGRICNISSVSVGKETYGVINIHSWGNSHESLYIGNFVSIANDVKFILGGNHNTSGVTTYPIRSMSKLNSPDVDATTKGKITIHDDVWIGFNSMILSGVTIERGSVVAAGAVVTKSFPAYSVIGGNPARLIKLRLSDEEINIANKIDFNAIELKGLTDEQIEIFYEKPTKSMLDKIKYRE